MVDEREEVQAVSDSCSAKAEPARCPECGGAGVTEEDAVGALGYVVKRPCPRGCAEPVQGSEKAYAALEPRARMWLESEHVRPSHRLREVLLESLTELLVEVRTEAFNAGYQTAPRSETATPDSWARRFLSAYDSGNGWMDLVEELRAVVTDEKGGAG